MVSLSRSGYYSSNATSKAERAQQGAERHIDRKSENFRAWQAGERLRFAFWGYKAFESE